jgi:prevent-host-death family protein
MNIAVSQAKARLTDLVRRAENGEEIVLTRHGQPAVRMVPAGDRPPADLAHRNAMIDAIIEQARGKATPGPCAARSQDFLYADDGIPG